MSFQGQFKIRALESIWLGGEVIAAASAGTTGNILVLAYDASGDILIATGTDVPTDATDGYAKGCLFIDRDVTTGSSGLYENVGTSSSCNFDVIGANTSLAAGGVDTDQLAADAVTGAKIEDDAVDSEHIADGAIDNAHLAADIITGDEIADDAVSLEHLDTGITPSHVVKFAGEASWSGGGTSLAETVTGVAATDIVIASIETVPSEAAYLVSAAASENTVTFTLSAANTTNDAVISYIVLRAAA